MRKSTFKKKIFLQKDKQIKKINYLIYNFDYLKKTNLPIDKDLYFSSIYLDCIKSKLS